MVLANVGSTLVVLGSIKIELQCDKGGASQVRARAAGAAAAVRQSRALPAPCLPPGGHGRACGRRPRMAAAPRQGWRCPQQRPRRASPCPQPSITHERPDRLTHCKHAPTQPNAPRSSRSGPSRRRRSPAPPRPQQQRKPSCRLAASAWWRPPLTSGTWAPARSPARPSSKVRKSGRTSCARKPRGALRAASGSPGPSCGGV